MSEQNTTPAAAPAKPKRPKSKSQLMAGALLDLSLIHISGTCREHS